MENHQDQLIGSLLGGRFRIQRLIGQGGMADVYLAQDEVNQLPLAVKVLKPAFVSDSELVHRFDVEAKSASSLNHPNIVKVYGVGEEQGIRYMVMQYVDGLTLKELIEQYGRLDWQVAVPLTLQIVRAVQAAHASGIIHRDIKPHNILVTRGHQALVTDFGIARAATANTITISGGQAMGSVHYFSPEQARGSIVGAKADLYSIGILLYEMVTGRLPFDGETSVAVALMQLHDTPKPPHMVEPSVPLGLSQIILKCMRKLPSERYESAQALGDELQAFLQNPQGQYGQVIEDPKAQTQVIQPALLRSPGEGLAKLLEVERQIEQNRKKRLKDTLLATALILIALILIAVFAYWALRHLSSNLGQASGETEGIALENYVDRPFEEVSDQLNQLKIPFQTKQAYSDEYAKGVVMAQNLPEGKQIKKVNLNTLVLTVSRGTDEFTLEDYAGRPALEVENILRGDLHLSVSTEPTTDPKVPVDQIIKTDPPAGARLRPGYSIRLYISTGPQLIAVPDLKGLTYEQAKTALTQAGLKLGEVSGVTDQTVKKRVVKAQSIAPGQQTALETAIDLEFGAKPKPTRVVREPLEHEDTEEESDSPFRWVTPRDKRP